MGLSFSSINIIPSLCVLFCLFFCTSTGCGDTSTGKEKPVAQKGVLDLRDWDFTRDGGINLDGQWEFYRDHLLDPSDFKKPDITKNRAFITVPGLWSKQRINGVSLPGRGCATYRLRILNHSDARMKTVSLRRVLSAYRLWLNGKLADEKGTVETPVKTREDYIFVHNKRLLSFAFHEGENEIILQVFNKEYESGGIDSPLRVDDEEATSKRELLKLAVRMIVSGMLMFASIYNILFYYFRREDAAYLYFGFFCLVMAINNYNHQFPILSGSLSYPANPFILNYITVVMAFILCLMTIKSLFPGEYSTLFHRLSQVLAAVFIIILFFVGFRSAERIMNIFFIFIIILVLYSIVVIIKAIMNREKDAMLFLVGFVALFSGVINDILYVMWIIDTAAVAQYGLIVLCITTTIVLSRRFSRALHTVENLSIDLAEKNISLMKLDRLKDQFLTNTSHELRTPLHGMIGLSELMIESAADRLTPREIENFRLVVSSGNRLASMVNDLLDMAKIQDEGLNLNLRPVDLSSLSEMVVKLSLPLVGEKPLEIINGIMPEIPAVQADEDRIRQVLYNLIGNAVKFTNKGRIEITARIIIRREQNDRTGHEDMIEVSVSDTGIGVPDDYKGKIFEAYQQVDGSDTRSYAGTGLGLAIAKRIIELHGGTISVASREQGGSVFTFTLPVSDEPVPAAPDNIIIESMDDALATDDVPVRTIHPSASGQNTFDGNPVILVVDDDPVNVRVIQVYLESKNCVVKTAADGIGALDIIEHDDAIDLVLLDIMMPVMSGYEVCRRIRNARTPEELPVVMLTAKNMMADIDAAFEAGANDYIVKPFRISELLARVSTMLKLRNVRKSAAEGITIHGRNTAYSLAFREIIYINAFSRNIIIHTDGQQITVPLQMKEIVQRLPSDMFVQIHKSHIINLRYLNSLSHVSSGRYRVRLRDAQNTEIPVGRAFLMNLRKKIS